MDITCFDDLLQAARLQPEHQRLLFVFAASTIPDDATPEQKARHARGEGGELTPVLCVDKTPDELGAFDALVEESRRTGHDWQVVFVAAMADRYNWNLNSGQYYIVSATVSAFLSHLSEGKLVKNKTEEGIMKFFRAPVRQTNIRTVL